MASYRDHRGYKNRPHEIFTYSSHEVYESHPSKIKKGHVHSYAVGFTCPRCSVVNKALDHGELTNCPKCGLAMQLWGNALYCFIDEQDWEDSKDSHTEEDVDDQQPPAWWHKLWGE